MQKEKFITVMAILDDHTQAVFQGIQEELESKYGIDTKTRDIPYHITLGSYAVEDTQTIVDRIIEVAKRQKAFPIQFAGVTHFGNVVRFAEPVISAELLALHSHFDNDYANGYPDWMPHATLYMHSEPTEIDMAEEMIAKVTGLSEAKIVGIELGEFWPTKKIIRVLFE